MNILISDFVPKVCHHNKAKNLYLRDYKIFFRMNDYEVVIGLEVHAQLSTLSKAYASDSAEFGASPNNHISVITLGHPGTLPRVNEKVINYAIKMGLATGCSIREYNEYARKNYFYADLPKGYQITQDTTPICFGGNIHITLKDGTQKIIGITRIHMEEDAGKSLHDQDMYDSLIDLNRAGVPLIEIVSEPDLRSSEEAYQYLTEVRKLLRYLDICDGNMEEGSMRCDANISVRKKGETKLGNRCEVKNLNSIRNVQRAIDFEMQRQIKELEAGGFIDQNTLNFDAAKGTTSVLRSKEMANDYRYFPEPDLPPVIISEKMIERAKSEMPRLPAELLKVYIENYGLSSYDAGNIADQKELAAYFDSIILHTENYKAAANWLMGPVKSYLNEKAVDISSFPLQAIKIAQIIDLIDSGKISQSVASKQLFDLVLAHPEETPLILAEKNQLILENNTNELQEYIKEVFNRFPDKLIEYKAGKKSLTGLFIGEVMKLTKGKIDPKIVNSAVNTELSNL